MISLSCEILPSPFQAQKAKSSKTARALSNLDNYEETFDLDDSDDSDELLEGGDSIQIKVQWKHQVLRIKAKKARNCLYN